MLSVRARIHRGATEVGGSCVEVESSGGERLILDMGLPLDRKIGESSEVLADLSGLRFAADGTLLGIVVSHAHPDHFGLVDAAPRWVPIYMGRATQRILREAEFFTPVGLDRQPAGYLADRRHLRIGPFTLTPYPADHSAFDAFSLCVDADDRRLFYTGDLRSHGRKRGTFIGLLERPPQHVDALLLEGTTVGRAPSSAAQRSEEGVEVVARELIEHAPGLVLACFSGQNIDRLVSIFRAARAAGRTLVIDLYGASIAEATQTQSIPRRGWEGLRVYVPNGQRVRVKETGEFWRVDQLGAARIFAEEIAEHPDRFVMTFRTSMAAELDRSGCLEDAVAIWSMWSGYLDGDQGSRTRGVFESLGIPVTLIHASGHATVEDLQRLADAVGADKVVPIHTDAPGRFSGLFDRVERRQDGEWWEV